MLKNGFEQYPVCKNLTGPLCGKMGRGGRIYKWYKNYSCFIVKLPEITHLKSVSFVYFVWTHFSLRLQFDLEHVPASSYK